MYRSRSKWASRAMLGIVAMLLPSFASAQVVVTYRPLEVAVPGLGSFAMLVLAAMLACAAVWMLKKQPGGGRMLVLALATAAVAMGAGGARLMGEAYATPPAAMDQSGGGTILVFGDTVIENLTSRTQRIVRIECGGPPVNATPQGAYAQANFGGPTCSADPSTVLEPGGECYINSADYACGANNGG